MGTRGAVREACVEWRIRHVKYVDLDGFLEACSDTTYASMHEVEVVQVKAKTRGCPGLS